MKRTCRILPHPAAGQSPFTPHQPAREHDDQPASVAHAATGAWQGWRLGRARRSLRSLRSATGRCCAGVDECGATKERLATAGDRQPPTPQRPPREAAATRHPSLASAVTPDHSARRSPPSAHGYDGHDTLPRRTRHPWRGAADALATLARRRKVTELYGAEPLVLSYGFELTRRPPGSLSPAGEHCYRAATGRRGAQRRPAAERRAAAGCSGRSAPLELLRHGRQRRRGGSAPEGSRARVGVQPVNKDAPAVDTPALWRHPHLSTAAQRRAAAERSERSERPSGARRPCAAPAHQTNALRSDALTQPPALPADVLGRRAPR